MCTALDVRAIVSCVSWEHLARRWSLPGEELLAMCACVFCTGSACAHSRLSDGYSALMADVDAAEKG